jgi:hypothetical protein
MPTRDDLMIEQDWVGLGLRGDDRAAWPLIDAFLRLKIAIKAVSIQASARTCTT